MHESSKGISWVTAHLLDERQVLKLCDQGQQMWALHFNGRGLGRWEGYYYYKSTDKCELSARRSDQNCFEEANEELPSISRRRITQCIQVTFYYNNYNYNYHYHSYFIQVPNQRKYLLQHYFVLFVSLQMMNNWLINERGWKSGESTSLGWPTNSLGVHQSANYSRPLPYLPTSSLFPPIYGPFPFCICWVPG